MRCLGLGLRAVAAAAWLALASAAADYDVLVYGGTPGGVQAALAAAHEGLTVLLVTPQPLLGGLMSGGLGNTDVGNRKAIGGASLAFFQAICRAYGRPDTEGCYTFEPHVAEGVFEALTRAAASRVTVRLDTTLAGVARGAAGGVASATFVPTAVAEAAPVFSLAVPALAAVADTVTARVFIDATYEGDLLAAAGIATAVGREGVAAYNESHAGVLAEPSKFGSHQFKVFVDAIDHATGLPLPFVSRDPPGAVGSGDAKVQAYVRPRWGAGYSRVAEPLRSQLVLRSRRSRARAVAAATHPRSPHPHPHGRNRTSASR